MKNYRSLLRNKLIQLSLIAVLGIAFLAFLLSAGGPFMRFWKVDLNFLLTPAIILVVMLILAASLPIVLRTQYALISSIAVTYSGLAFFTYLVLQRATLFTRLPVLNHNLDSLNVLRSAALPIVFFWFGLGIYQISNLLAPRPRSNPGYKPLLAMLGFFLLGFSVWKTLDILAGHWQGLQGTGITVGIPLLLVSLTRMISYITTPVSPILEGSLNWCLKNPVKFFWLSTLIMLYFVFARPRVYSISPYAYLIEWVLVCFLGYQILNQMKKYLKEHHSEILREKDWRKHQQIVNRIEDDDFNKMVILQEEFVESGIRRNLLVYLRQLLMNNGISQTEVTDLLLPVIEYNDDRLKWYNRWFFKKRLLLRNRYQRGRVLEESMDKIRIIIYPGRNKRTGI